MTLKKNLKAGKLVLFCGTMDEYARSTPPGKRRKRKEKTIQNRSGRKTKAPVLLVEVRNAGEVVLTPPTQKPTS